MVDQLRKAPLASPPAPAFGTGAAVVSSHRLAPRNMRSDGVPASLPRAHEYRPYPLPGVGPSGYGVWSLRRRFSFHRRPQGSLGYLGEKWRPPPDELGKAPSTTVATETFGVNVYSKTGMKAPKK